MELELNRAVPGSFFWHEGTMYCKTCTAGPKGCQCRLVSKGDYGPVVQPETEVWIAKDARVRLVPMER